MVYLVGQHKSNSDWEVQGVFDLEADAVEACKNSSCFIMPIEKNKEFPLETMGEIGYFPNG